MEVKKIKICSHNFINYLNINTSKLIWIKELKHYCWSGNKNYKENFLKLIKKSVIKNNKNVKLYLNDIDNFFNLKKKDKYKNMKIKKMLKNTHSIVIQRRFII